MKKRLIFLLCALHCLNPGRTQKLQPGFLKQECVDLMKISAQFGNYFHPPYLFLAEKLTIGLPAKEKIQAMNILNGEWLLEEISGADLQAFRQLNRNQPVLSISAEKQAFSGNTGCNSLRGSITLNGFKLAFQEPYVMTKMLCEGSSEKVFLENLRQVSAYSMPDDRTLLLKNGELVLLRFSRK